MIDENKQVLRAEAENELQRRVRELIEQRASARAAAEDARQRGQDELAAHWHLTLEALWQEMGLQELAGYRGLAAVTERTLAPERFGWLPLGGESVMVRIHASDDWARDVNHWVGLEVRTIAGGWHDFNWRWCPDSPTRERFPSAIDLVVEKAALWVDVVQRLRERARRVLQHAVEIGAAWQEWDDTCRRIAGDATLRLWDPTEMWRVRFSTRHTQSSLRAAHTATVVTLDAADDIARALSGGEAAQVHVVEKSGVVRDRWLFEVIDAEPVAAMEPTIEETLPYHHNIPIGRYWVNVPPTESSAGSSIEALTTPDKGSLLDVPAALNGRWSEVMKGMGVYFASDDEDDAYWPRRLAVYGEDDLIAEYGDFLGLRTVHEELEG